MQKNPLCRMASRALNRYGDTRVSGPRAVSAAIVVH
jgi:hypothetical protein